MPVIIYRNVVHHELPDIAGSLETLFAANGWAPGWRGTLHDHHHFHAATHEVFGVSDGSAVVVLGGPAGTKVALDETDAIFLPAGTGHCQLRGSSDFQVVTAYPSGHRWDVLSAAADAKDLATIETLPAPACDPVLGKNGPLFPTPARRD